jgi:hypothetical protein
MAIVASGRAFARGVARGFFFAQMDTRSGAGGVAESMRHAFSDRN